MPAAAIVAAYLLLIGCGAKSPNAGTLTEVSEKLTGIELSDAVVSESGYESAGFVKIRLELEPEGTEKIAERLSEAEAVPVSSDEDPLPEGLFVDEVPVGEELTGRYSLIVDDGMRTVGLFLTKETYGNGEFAKIIG